MNRPRKEFIDRWKRHLAGALLYGTTATHKEGPLARASAVFEITAEVEELLGKLWDDDEATKTPSTGAGTVTGTNPPANGATNGTDRNARGASQREEGQRPRA